MAPQSGSPSVDGPHFMAQRKEEETLILKDQCRNVAENKGQQLKTLGLSRNVYENKGA
jgi:hypothetical protein